MGGKVHGTVVRERARRIRAISVQLAGRFRETQIGRVHQGLTVDDGSLVVTGNYLKLRVAPGVARNEWVKVRMTSDQHGELLGG
jgi:tRNA A37 methylthiotransferase MiaB